MSVKEDIKKYNEMDSKALLSELKEAKKRLAGDILKVQAGKLDKSSEISKQRKNVARISTIINSKNLE
jgi:ribosomal protein L29